MDSIARMKRPVTMESKAARRLERINSRENLARAAIRRLEAACRVELIKQPLW